ncbi:hypothetical protein BKA62DRAFT_724154 [Auriculariales sp. MPI-PUGE-AT-0066]|nr:hypothetical protein BKA62DRAFT_724154 [Auriculariales sp. MPI-PUGE-AT-0066]
MSSDNEDALRVFWQPTQRPPLFSQRTMMDIDHDDDLDSHTARKPKLSPSTYDNDQKFDTGLGLGFGGGPPGRRSFARTLSDPSQSQSDSTKESEYPDPRRRVRPQRHQGWDMEPIPLEIEAMRKLERMVKHCMKTVERAGPGYQLDAGQSSTSKPLAVETNDAMDLDELPPARTSAPPARTSAPPPRPQQQTVAKHPPVKLRGSKTRVLEESLILPNSRTTNAARVKAKPPPPIVHRAKTSRNGSATTQRIVSGDSTSSSGSSYYTMASSSSSSRVSATTSDTSLSPESPSISLSQATKKQLGMRRTSTGPTASDSSVAPAAAPTRRTPVEPSSVSRAFKPPQFAPTNSARAQVPTSQTAPMLSQRQHPPGVTVLYPSRRSDVFTSTSTSTSTRSSYFTSKTSPSVSKLSGSTSSRLEASYVKDDDDEPADPSSDISLDSLGIPEEDLDAFLSQFERPR